MRRLLLASNNAKKRAELQQLLAAEWEVVCPAQLGLALEVDETGEDFLSNARLKAVAFARAVAWPTGLSGANTSSAIDFVLADDSGLEVLALGGAPGVRSARYAADAFERVAELVSSDRGGMDQANNLKLLAALKDVPASMRGACFRCVLVMQGVPGSPWADWDLTAQGQCEGEIAEHARGAEGFGYDPLFLPKDDNPAGASMAELGSDYKSRHSHRARAIQDLLDKLLSLRKA